MFKEFFKKIYKSKKTVSKETANKMLDEKKSLQQQIDKRQRQIEKFELLIVEDPDHKERYLERITVHKKFIKKHVIEIEEIEIFLLDS